MIAMTAIWCTLGIAGFAGWMIFVVQQMEARLSTLFESSLTVMNLIKNIGGGDASFNAGFLSAMFVLLPLFLMAFAVTQFSDCRATEQVGRLQLILAPPPRRLAGSLARLA